MLLANVKKRQCSINNLLSIHCVPTHMLYHINHVHQPIIIPTLEIGKSRLTEVK